MKLKKIWKYLAAGLAILCIGVFIGIFMYTLSIGDAIPLKGEEHYQYERTKEL